MLSTFMQSIWERKIKADLEKPNDYESVECDCCCKRKKSERKRKEDSFSFSSNNTILTNPALFNTVFFG